MEGRLRYACHREIGYGKVSIGEATFLSVKDHMECIYRGKGNGRHKGEIDMYFVEGIKKDKV